MYSIMEFYIACLRPTMNIVIVLIQCNEMSASRRILEIFLLWSISALYTTVSTAVFKERKTALNNFELLDYDPSELLAQHERVRRETTQSTTIRFSFSAYNRTYNFVLAPVDSERGGVFAHDFVVTVNGQQKAIDLDTHYRGHSLDDSNMTIFGGISLGYFTGTVTGDNEQLFIEPAHRFYNSPSTATRYHSIVYRSSDIDPQYSNGVTCGVNHGHPSLLPLGKTAHLRKTRAVVDPNKTICNLLIIADERFYQSYTSGAQSERFRMIQTSAFVTEVIQGVNEIYYNTDFDGTQGIRFVISNLTILTEAPSGFESSTIGHELYLELHSQADHSQYCLAYRVTAREFDGGVLGFAYVSQGSTLAGICAQYRASGITYNTGIVTITYFGGQTVPIAQVMLAVAHEIGHNFGSNHDPLSCQPDSASGGKYIMHAIAVRGDEPNNRMFSSCSRTIMGNYIRVVGQDMSNGCFQEDRGLCGNGIIDPGEDCDCGFFTGPCPLDPCCVADTCQLMAGVMCSPQQGPCCHGNCTFQGSGTKCAEEVDCAAEQFCNNMQATCPPATPRNENATCQNNYYVCQSGYCNGSLCILFGLTSCLCEGGDPCDVCCSLDGQCQSMATQVQQLNATLSRYLQPGASCIGQTVRGRKFDDGYCDQLHRCREIDPDDALVAQLLNFLQQYTSVAEWMRAMWWVMVLASVGVLLVLIMIVIVCDFSLRKAESAKFLKKGKVGEQGKGKKVRGGTHKSRRTKVISLQHRGGRVGPANC